MSTTIQPGLEVRRLAFKDDSFRQADHEPIAGYGTLGWWDNTAGNAITFSNNDNTGTDTLLGGATTYGAMNIFQSSAITNGDELYLPGSIEVEKDFPVGIPANIILDLRLRAKNAGVGTAVLTIQLLDATLSPISTTLPIIVSLVSSLYTHYTVPIFLVIPYSSTVYGIRLLCDNGAYIDYVALGSIDYINQGGLSLNVTIPKKTDSQTRPMTTDIIQQLGISSRSKAVMIPKISTLAYTWLKDKLNRSIPLELLPPTQQATGYLSDIKRHSEAGWVGRPIPSSDYLHVTTAGQQLYDISFSLIKADNEVNIDLTCPVIPLPMFGSIGTKATVSLPPLPPHFVTFSSGICSTDNSRANDSYQRHGWYMAGLWWAFYTNDCALQPPNHAGLWYRTSSDRVNWSAATQITTSARPDETFNTGLWFDGTYLYYVAGDGHAVSSPSTNMWWRRGTPKTDGTIDWGITSEQVITPPSGGNAKQSVLWCFTDASGASWVCSGRAYVANNYVQRNANINGTWSTNLSHTQYSTRLGAVPLPNGNVVMFWTTASAPYYHSFSVYNGSTWSSTVTGSGGDYDGISFSCVSTANNQVHMTYINDHTPSQLVYLVYDAPSNSILSETVIAGAVFSANDNATIATDSGGANTNVFWGDTATGKIYFFKRRVSDGAMSPIVSQSYYFGVLGRGVESWDDSGGYLFFWFSNFYNDIVLCFWTP